MMPGRVLDGGTNKMKIQVLLHSETSNVHFPLGYGYLKIVDSFKRIIKLGFIISVTDTKDNLVRKHIGLRNACLCLFILSLKDHVSV